VTPGPVSRRVVADRLATLDELLRDIRSLPLGNREAFFSDRRNLWAAESCLRRGLEALLDVGRHILAKGFGQGVSEYKEIANRLAEEGVLEPAAAGVLRTMAGYRNRMVHFYHEVTPPELFEVCTTRLGDLESVRDALLAWLKKHPDQVDRGP